MQLTLTQTNSSDQRGQSERLATKPCITLNSDPQTQVTTSGNLTLTRNMPHAIHGILHTHPNKKHSSAWKRRLSYQSFYATLVHHLSHSFLFLGCIPEGIKDSIAIDPRTVSIGWHPKRRYMRRIHSTRENSGTGNMQADNARYCQLIDRRHYFPIAPINFPSTWTLDRHPTYLIKLHWTIPTSCSGPCIFFLFPEAFLESNSPLQSARNECFYPNARSTLWHLQLKTPTSSFNLGTLCAEARIPDLSVAIRSKSRGCGSVVWEEAVYRSQTSDTLVIFKSSWQVVDNVWWRT